jgi:hypothetical protein
MLTIWVFLGASAQAAELPPDTWVKVDENGGGIRSGAAVVWLDKEKKFLVVGGAHGNAKKKIPRKYEVQTFDPATRTWAEVKPEGMDFKTFDWRRDRHKLLMKNAKGQCRLHPGFPAGSHSTWDAAARRLYVFGKIGVKAFPMAAYDVNATKWDMVSTKRPPTEADGIWRGQYGHAVAFMERTAPVLDPINHEILFIGGRTGNHPKGFVGHWAFSLKAKGWRKLEQKDGAREPIREKIDASVRAARDALAVARNLHYGVEAVTRDALKPALSLLDEALKQADNAAVSRDTTAYGAASAVVPAVRGIQTARSAFAEGTADAATMKTLFDAIWKLDEAADRLRVLPGPRVSAAVGYDPVHKCVVVFGGDHGDYLLGDTWVYDCAKKTWRQVFPERSPRPRRAAGRMVWLPGRKQLALVGGSTYSPRFYYFQRRSVGLSDVWTFDAKKETWTLISDGGGKNAPRPALSSRIAASDDDTLIGLSRTGRWRTTWTSAAWLMRIEGDGDPKGAKKLGVPPGTRTYFSVVKEYDPTWYDAAPKPDPKAVADWLAKLKPNTWTAVPKAPRPCPQRDWGTCVFDPDRDQWYHWTGGHMADPANIVSTYHPAIHRWSIPFIPSYMGKGIDFNGRPDCRNHTYLNYAYDTVSRKLVCTWGGGTSLYDPDRRDFEPFIPQPFMQHAYFTKTCTTPKGVVVWTRGYWGLLDAEARTWKKLPVKGKLPRIVHGDENAIAYDSKRDCLWLMAADGYQKMNGQVWRYDMKDGAVKPMDPAHMKTLGVKVRPRESVYLPRPDLVLYNAFAGGRQVAYDPAKNRWVVLNVKKTQKDLGGVSIGLMVDPKRGLVWAMSSAQRMFVLRIDPETLTLSEELDETK